MNLKNYTSEVAASTSISKIENALVKYGATDISKKYENGVCVAFRFRMLIDLQPLFFELPAKVDACYKVLWKEIKKPQPNTQARVKAQAERTAWKIISDWVEVQLSMIHLEQVEKLQIFLPYAYNPNTDKTFFEEIKNGGYKALTNDR